MIEGKTTGITVETFLSEAIGFGQSLKDCPEYQNYLRAREEAEGSSTAHRLQEELLRTRSAVQQAMHGGRDVSELMKTFQEKQQQFENLPEMRRLIQAQQQLVNLFQTIARQISDAAGVDFIEANAIQGGCCG